MLQVHREHDTTGSVGEQRDQTEGTKLHWNDVSTQSAGARLVPGYCRRQVPYQVACNTAEYTLCHTLCTDIAHTLCLEKLELSNISKSAVSISPYHPCPVAFWSLSALEQLRSPHHQRHIRCLSGVWSGTTLHGTSG